MTQALQFTGPQTAFPASFRALLGNPGAGALFAGSGDGLVIGDSAEALALISPDFRVATPGKIDPALPVLAVFGTRDEERREKEASLRAAIPHAHVILVYDAGETIAADRPEALARLVADFIRRKEAFLVNDADGFLTP